MATIGREAARAPLTSADINDGIVTAADLASTLDLSSKTLTMPTISSLTLSGNLSVDGGTIKLDGNYPVGTDNVALGDTALDSNVSGNENTAIGSQALTAATASELTAVGYRALGSNTSGARNVAIGRLAAFATTTGGSSVSVGTGAAYSNTSGSYNTALGDLALFANTTASNNTAVGYQAGYSNVTGAEVTAVGSLSLYNNTATGNTGVGYGSLYGNTTGVYNSAFGNAMGGNTSGSYNSAFGHNALASNTTSSNNTAFGYQAGYSHVSSIGGNAFLGKQAGYSTTSALNTFVGDSAGYNVTTGANNTILGRFNGNQGGLDIRTSSGNIVLSDGNGNPRAHYKNANESAIAPGVAHTLVKYVKSVSVSASATTDLITLTQNAYSFMLMAKVHIMFIDSSYPNGNISIVANLAGHTSDALSTMLNDYNVIDTAFADASGGSVSFTTAASASKTTSVRDGVLKIQATTNASTSGTAYIVLEGYTDGITIS